MANRPHTLTAEELKNGALATGQVDSSILAQVLGTDVLTGSVRIIPDTEVKYRKYKTQVADENIIVAPCIAVDVYVDFVIQSDVIFTRDSYGLITGVKISGSTIGNNVLLVMTTSAVHVPGAEYPTPILQDGYTNSFTFFTSGIIQNGTTIEHRTMQGARYNSMELFCSTVANADVNVSILKDGTEIATGSLESGIKYKAIDLDPGFQSGPENELVAVVTTDSTSGSNLRIRIK